MGLVSWVVTLPVAPIRGVIALGRVIQRRAEQEASDPATVRRELEAIEEARAAGEVSAEEEAEAQERAVESVVKPDPPAPAESEESGTER